MSPKIANPAHSNREIMAFRLAGLGIFLSGVGVVAPHIMEIQNRESLSLASKVELGKNTRSEIMDAAKRQWNESLQPLFKNEFACGSNVEYRGEIIGTELVGKSRGYTMMSIKITNDQVLQFTLPSTGSNSGELYTKGDYVRVNFSIPQEDEIRILCDFANGNIQSVITHELNIQKMP